MKKLIMIVLSMITFGVSASYAYDLEVSGTIPAVGKSNRRVTINNIDGEKVTFAVVPSTDIEFENRFMENAQFSDLKVGQYIKVEYTPGTTKTLVADEIDIYTGNMNY